MFNVLPEILKEEIKREYYIRRLIVSAVFILFIQFCFLIFLLPSWVGSVYKEKELSNQVEFQNNSLVSKDTNEILETIKTVNQTMKKISVISRYPEFVPIIDSIISFKSKSISLDNFSYGYMGSSTAALSIEGESASREALVSFVKKLEDSKKFTKINSPISNLKKDKDIDFIISLEVVK